MLFLGFDALGMPVFSARSFGAWWGKLGAGRLGWRRSRPGVGRCNTIRAVVLLPPSGVAPCGSSIRPPVR